MTTAKLVEKFRGSRVVALDLVGDEAGFPLDVHIGAYRYARENGLSRTAHAGEGLGPESVWETLRLLDPQRIGHGTRSIEDPKLMEHLREKRIHLELCPLANVQIIPSIGSMEDSAVFGPLGGCLYNTRMPNRAYASVWVRDFSEENMLTHFEHFLATVPLAATPPGFTGMTVRAVDFTETPLEEYDLRGYLTTPEEVVNLAKEHHSGDVCYEVATRWDLWIRDKESASWKLQPERMDIFCYGPDYDGGVFAESGHFMVDLGFEHLFTGHAGLLTAGNGRVAEPQHPEEARFLMWMSQPQNLREYQEKTRENIQKLMGWIRAVEEALPVERFRLWSEGEENFEARLDEILAVR